MFMTKQVSIGGSDQYICTSV